MTRVEDPSTIYQRGRFTYQSNPHRQAIAMRGTPILICEHYLPSSFCQYALSSSSLGALSFMDNNAGTRPRLAFRAGGASHFHSCQLSFVFPTSASFVTVLNLSCPALRPNSTIHALLPVRLIHSPHRLRPAVVGTWKRVCICGNEMI
jgi:hypothetical protein